LISSSEIERRELIELAQFVINRKTNDLRNELYEFLVEIGLYDVDENVTKSQLIDIIKRRFGFSVFPQQIINSTLIQLEKKKNILIEKIGLTQKYKLPVDKKQKLMKMVESHKQLREHFTKSILDKIAKIGSLSDVDKKDIVDSAFDFLGRSLSILSIRFAEILIKPSYEFKHLDELLYRGEILEKSFARIEDQNVRRDAINATKETLTQPDKKIALFLYSIAQSYFLLQILNVDPECQTLQKNLFLLNMTVYFDTNIIIDLLCEKSEQRFHRPATRLIELMKSLDIKMRFSSRTLKELYRTINISEETLKRIGYTERKRKIRDYIDDPFVEEYSKLLDEMPFLRWENFIGRMKKFTSILERKYNIFYDRANYNDIFQNPDFLDISKMISEADPYKPDYLVEHDCFHLLLVDKLRSKEDLFPKYWFITRDKSVCLAEQMRLISEKRKG